MVLTYFRLRHLELCCLQTDVLPHWLVTSTVQYIPLHHKMSGFEGMVSDILTVCWFLICLSYINIEMITQRTIYLLCWWIVQCLKQWLMCMFICTFTNLNTNACDQNKLRLKIFLSYLQLIITNISFVSITCISHRQVCFSKRCFC
jgi:hypothetical protein